MELPQHDVSTSSRRGRWRRTQHPDDVETGVSRQEDAHEASVKGVSMASTLPGSKPRARRIVYTLGTWRVSREMYLWQLERLGVKLLVDVRGNPRAGREETLHKGKDFTRALLSVGIKYEYWGDSFGEDQLDEQEADALRSGLKGLFAAAPIGPVCLFGHLHEPHKCHRLRLCDFLNGNYDIQHLLWSDHSEIRCLSHDEAIAKYKSSVDFFMKTKRETEAQRLTERQSHVCHANKWTRYRQTDGFDMSATASAVAAAAAAAASLPVLTWQDLSAAEWGERMRDGKDYRVLLPWQTELLWYPRFLSGCAANDLESLIHEKITMYHPTYRFQTPSGIEQETINRKGQAKICDDFTFSVQYSSRGDERNTYEVDRVESWSKSLLRRVEAASESVFNAIWFNHYRDGTVTIHWHTDSDEGLGPNAIIGSLSLGATREFSLKSKRELQAGSVSHRSTGLAHVSFPLYHGSLLVMGQNSQTHWLHAVPAMEGVDRDRTNLTFRFYAHEDLQKVNHPSVSHSKDKLESGAQSGKTIHLSNSKLLSAYPNCDVVPQEGGQRTMLNAPNRLRLIPDRQSWQKLGRAIRPILIDMPESDTSVGQLCKRLCDQLLPDEISVVGLAAVSHDGATLKLDDKMRVIDELIRLGATGRNIVDMIIMPGDGLAESSCAIDQAQPFCTLSSIVWADLLDDSDCQVGAMFAHELANSPVGHYKAPQTASRGISAIDGSDWVCEAIQNLSGIQRKSKARGQTSQFVFHQCTEFVALHAGHAKSTVHLVIAPKRVLSIAEVTAADVPLVRRLAAYAGHLIKGLAAQYPARLFAAGFRTRRGRVEQLHVHLLSMDLAAPRCEDFERKHFEDFTGGPSRFLSLSSVCKHLGAGGKLTNLENLRSQVCATEGLICHRCGQRFGDAMRQLWEHLGRCEIWPHKANHCRETKKETTLEPAVARLLEERTCADVAVLQEMGFGDVTPDSLRAILHAEGSVERAIGVLAGY